MQQCKVILSVLSHKERSSCKEFVRPTTVRGVARIPSPCPAYSLSGAAENGARRFRGTNDVEANRDAVSVSVKASVGRAMAVCDARVADRLHSINGEVDCSEAMCQEVV